uniref:Lysophospholipase 1 ) n=1 Tax=Ganoderma boninense TaxID=34458 RepID=A0A5K1JZ03_9APHY|nr:Lysophospholipase 1 (EC (Phospholipase B 1) [Ganoderma boninense]
MQRIDNLRCYPQPLTAHFTHPNRDTVNAYELCYLAERVVDPIQSHSDTVRAKLVNIRILGHLLSQSGLLSETAISKVAQDIISCREESMANDETQAEALVNLGAVYKDVLLRPFHKSKRQIPDVSSPGSINVSSPSSKSDEESSSSSIRASPVSWASFKLAEDEAKHREDHRCIATRILDLPFAEGLHSQTGEFYAGDVSCLRLCHIFPELAPEAVDTASSDSDGVYSLENVMMVTPDLRARFDVLSLWFEPIEDVPNRYRLCSPWVPPNGLRAGQEITFQSTDPRLALPNREFLAVHAACCRVTHLSGAFGLLGSFEVDLD